MVRVLVEYSRNLKQWKIIYLSPSGNKIAPADNERGPLFFTVRFAIIWPEGWRVSLLSNVRGSICRGLTDAWTCIVRRHPNYRQNVSNADGWEILRWNIASEASGLEAGYEDTASFSRAGIARLAFTCILRNIHVCWFDVPVGTAFSKVFFAMLIRHGELDLWSHEQREIAASLACFWNRIIHSWELRFPCVSLRFYCFWQWVNSLFSLQPYGGLLRGWNKLWMFGYGASLGMTAVISASARLSSSVCLNQEKLLHLWLIIASCHCSCLHSYQSGSWKGVSISVRDNSVKESGTGYSIWVRPRSSQKNNWKSNTLKTTALPPTNLNSSSFSFKSQIGNHQWYHLQSFEHSKAFNR